MECIVEYDYIAAQDDELTIHRGDIIKNVVPFEDGWKKGCLNGKEGVFPDNFVRVLNNPNMKTSSSMNEDVINKFKEQLIMNVNKEDGMYQNCQYPGTMPCENKLESNSNAVINKNNCIPNSQYKSEQLSKSCGDSENDQNHYKNGVIPLIQKFSQNHTENNQNQINCLKQHSQHQHHQQQQQQNQVQQQQPLCTVVVMFEYKAENPDELNLEVGEIIKVLDKNLIDDGWWKGFKKSGEIGIFPSNFVEPIIDSMMYSNVMKRSRKDDMSDVKSTNMVSSASVNDLTLGKRSQDYHSPKLLHKSPNSFIKTKNVNVSCDSKAEFKPLIFPESSKGDDLSNSYEKNRLKGSRNASPANHDFTTLKSEFEKFKNEVDYKFSKLNIRIQTLIEEIDEEKKQRAASEIELVRLRRVVHMLDGQAMNGSPI